MKITPKKNVKIKKTKKKTNVEPKKEQVLIVAQEIKFARLLSGNEKKTRDRALKSLKKWLTNCFQRNYAFKESDFIRIWKGLFYAVWMSDKPLIQEELCENIASILDLFPPEQLTSALLLVKAGFKVLATEWYGIDQHRMDKCLMLVRRYLRGSLRCLQRCNWKPRCCRLYAKMLSEDDGLLAVSTPLYARNATSMILHVIDCFLEELAKVSNGDIAPLPVAELLRPFCLLTCFGQERVATAARRLFSQLVRQSDQGLEYRERTRAWEKMGCPEGGPDALEPISDDDEDDEQNGDIDQSDDDSTEKPLDPRAGRVDVLLPTLPVPSEQLAAILKELLGKTSSKAYRRTKICMERFEQLSANSYPLRVRAPPAPSEESPRPAPSAAAKSLVQLERKLVASSDELALRGLSRKHRKRLLARSREGRSIVDEGEGLDTDTPTTQNGDWKVEDEPQTKKKKTDISDKKATNNKKRKLEKTQKNKKLDYNKVKTRPDEKQIERNRNTVKNAPRLIGDSKKNEKSSTDASKEDSVTQKVNAKTQKLNEKTQKLNADTQKIKIDNQKLKTQSKANNENKANNEIFKANNGFNKAKKPTVVAKKVKNFQKQLSPKVENKMSLTPKKVKFVLKNNSMQEPVEYYKSVRQSPSIPFDSSKKPTKTNLKVSTPSPINPFFKKKLKLRK